MCGVFGYVGAKSDVGGAVLKALKTLEYRGYDSWGLAVATADGLIVDKEPGRINGQEKHYPVASAGLGHTRWATHGGVTAANAHPHLDESRRFAIVHNGIIENHASLKAGLVERGHRFTSETDSEVVVHLIEEETAAGHDLPAALARVFQDLEGYNAVVVLDRHSSTFAVVKRVSPLVIGRSERGSTVASDAIAMLGHADELVYLEDDQLAILTANGVALYDRQTMEPLPLASVPMASVDSNVALGDYPHFMAKEMAEQPATLRRLLAEARPEIQDLAAVASVAERITLVGCGTAANAALAGTYLFSQVCGREVNMVPASEFRYRAGSISAGTLVIAISQSGETIDILEAVAEARRRGAGTAAIVNTPNSSLDRMVGTRVLLRCGAEQCVLATKSYTAMLATLLLTAGELAGDQSSADRAVESAATSIQHLLADGTLVALGGIGARIASAEHLFVIGRGVHYASALEAALKIKEVSYVHAEGFAAGELKHGVIALVEPGTPCLVFAPNDDTRIDVLSGAAELKCRGGHLIGIGSANDPVFDEFITVPDVGVGNGIVEALPGQYLGYFAALARGNDPDRPRNLAKSVTVK